MFCEFGGIQVFEQERHLPLFRHGWHTLSHLTLPLIWRTERKGGGDHVEKLILFQEHILIHVKRSVLIFIRDMFFLNRCLYTRARIMHLHTLDVNELTLTLIALRVELIPQIPNLFSQSRIKIKLDRKLWDPEPTGIVWERQMPGKLSYETNKRNNVQPWGQTEMAEWMAGFIHRQVNKEIWMGCLKQRDIGGKRRSKIEEVR